MSIPKQVLPLCVVAPLLVFAASCVDSKNPLSDEKTSKIDERLIGTWTDQDNTVWKIAKAAKDKNSFDLALCEGDESLHYAMFTTTVKSKSYLSTTALQGEPDDAEKKPESVAYRIYQYVFVGNDTLEIRDMDPIVLIKAIDDKKLGGEVVISKRTVKPLLGFFGKDQIVEEKTPIITDTSENIALYLENHANECFSPKAKAFFVLKRKK